MHRTPALLLAGLVLSSSLIFSECIPFDQARQHVGETRCITGRVVGIEQGMRGVHYLDFCEDYRLCRFTAVIFSKGFEKRWGGAATARTRGGNTRPGEGIR